MSQVRLARERFADVIGEVGDLLTKHWREIAAHQDIPLDVDVARYMKVDEAGAMRCYIARLDGPIIGYAAFFVDAHLHYAGSLQAVQDVVYVDPDHRRGAVGLDLLRYAEDELRAEGVQVIMHHQKTRHRALGVVLRFMGYDAIETVWQKRLDRTQLQEVA